ncbi:MAG: hypothetical protein F6K41_37530 [Symploca sp. SIO3E6]|nr:hypothetical protein [Caldora sp. SIO3E6]
MRTPTSLRSRGSEERNYVGIAERYENETSIYVYRLMASAEVPSRSSLSNWHGSDRSPGKPQLVSTPE